MARDITVEVDLPYGPKAVWFALTDPGALAEWLMPVTGFAPVVGTAFTLRAKPMPGWDGVVHCEVTDVDEPARLHLAGESDARHDHRRLAAGRATRRRHAASP